MEHFEITHLDSFFQDIIRKFPAQYRFSSFLITHLLPERPSFVRAVAEQTELIAVLPKPKSINEDALQEVRKITKVDTLSRQLFSKIDLALDYLEKRAKGQDIILLDVGGYYAGVLNELAEVFSGRIIGVVEDTENGYKRYLELDNLPCPIFSVARSRLKVPEDYLVGQSIAFSVEMLVRGRGDVLAGMEACVIGYGKLGSSIAQMLYTRNMRVTVFDKDPVRMTQAKAAGYHVVREKKHALSRAGVIICATGNHSLLKEDFANIKNGAYVASVTSSEDELELAELSSVYQITPVAPHVSRYSTVGHYFYVLADGNAVNFLHGAVVGPYIYLVQAEILVAISKITEDLAPGLYTVADADRKIIADTWLAYFNR
ncbi:MAG: adenosylhomocysteinase [Thermoactinomyces sp.]